MASERPAFTTGKIASSSSSTPFFIVPAVPLTTPYHSSGKSSTRTVSFAKPAAAAPAVPKPAPIIVDPASLVSYRAPEHKHAHHLHSIPPREKTAKTLILDHMLWQHMRARFLQARSELGLSPASSQPHLLTTSGNPSSPYHHQQPSELHASPTHSTFSRGSDEDADVGAEDHPERPSYEPPSELDEDIRALKFGVRGFDRIKASLEQAHDRYADTVDLDTARVQRATAEGMEKVLSSLLTQSFTPTSHSGHDHGGGAHIHAASDGKSCICHNVRMRVELSALVNDFFARDHMLGGPNEEDCSDTEDESETEEIERRNNYEPLSQPLTSPRTTQSPMSISSLVTSRSSRPPSPPISTLSGVSRSANGPARHLSISTAQSQEPILPSSLHPILPVSSYAPPTKLINNSSDALGKAGYTVSNEPRRSLAPPNSIFSAVPRGAGPDSPWALGPGNGMGWPARVPVPLPAPNTASSSAWGAQGGNGNESGAPIQSGPRVWKAIGRSRELFNGGVTRGRSSSESITGSIAKPDIGGPSSSTSAGKNAIPSLSRSAAAVGQAACPRHLRDTDSCPRSCIHRTFSSAPIPANSSSGATTIGAGLSRPGLPLRRPQSTAKSATTRPQSRSRSYSIGTSSSQTYSSGKSTTSTAASSKSSSQHTNPQSARAQTRNPRKNSDRETRMADVLPRFLRFSALIAKELGREARETGEQKVLDVMPQDVHTTVSTSATNSGFASHNSSHSSHSRSHSHHGSSFGAKETLPIHLQPSSTGHARPTRAWYALLCGIVTRAVLEGYIRGKWKGADPLEVLFGLGLGNWVKNLPELASLSPTETASSQNGAKSTGRRDRSISSRGDTDTDMQNGTASEYATEDLESSSSSSSSSSSDEEDSYSVSNKASAAFEPDGMPSIEEAVRILFGRGVIATPQQDSALPERATFASSPTTSPTRYGGWAPASPTSSRYSYISPGGPTPWSRGALVRPGVGGSDPDWEWETSERISEFATISLTSPDLLTHLQELSRRYPPEPVERAALRFFESVAEWRGMPELETYKTRRAAAAASSHSVSAEPRVKVEDETGGVPSGAGQKHTSSTPLASQTSSVSGYFTIPKEVHHPMPATPSTPSSSIYANKKRGADDLSSPASTHTFKTARSESTVLQGEVEPGWTGPYGI